MGFSSAFIPVPPTRLLLSDSSIRGKIGDEEKVNEGMILLVLVIFFGGEKTHVDVSVEGM